MSKHFYFGASVFSILAVYVLDAMGAEVKTLLLVGLAFLFFLVGAALNELYERRKASEAFERSVRGRLEEISFELQILRDNKYNELQNRSCSIVQTLEAIGKAADAFTKDGRKVRADEEPKPEEAPNLKGLKR